MRSVMAKSKKFTEMISEVAKECVISDTVYETLKASARACTNSKQTTVWSVSVRKQWQNTTNASMGMRFGFHKLEEAGAGVIIGDRANAHFQFNFECHPGMLLVFVEEKLEARPDFKDAIACAQPFLAKLSGLEWEDKFILKPRRFAEQKLIDCAENAKKLYSENQIFKDIIRAALQVDAPDHLPFEARYTKTWVNRVSGMKYTASVISKTFKAMAEAGLGDVEDGTFVWAYPVLTVASWCEYGASTPAVKIMIGCLRCDKSARLKFHSRDFKGVHLLKYSCVCGAETTLEFKDK